MRGHHTLKASIKLYKNPDFLMRFQISIIVLSKSASYLLEIIMLIS